MDSYIRIHKNKGVFMKNLILMAFCLFVSSAFAENLDAELQFDRTVSFESGRYCEGDKVNAACHDSRGAVLAYYYCREELQFCSALRKCRKNCMDSD